ncbi:MAG: type 1 glutamine amidotransferase [Pseudomonadota bacterium]
MKIGILQTGHVNEQLVAENGDYSEIFPAFLADQGLSFETYAVCDGLFPDGPEMAEGWLITGSRFGAYEDWPWIAPLEQLIRDIYASDRPLVGICFGHQIIAQALGGRVEKFSGGWCIGRQDYVLNGETYALNAWHQDQVVAVPEGGEVISSTGFCENAAIVYGNRAFTLQPHPEINRTYLSGMLMVLGLDTVPQALRDAAIAQLDRPTHSARLADMIAQFFKEKRIA